MSIKAGNRARANDFIFDTIAGEDILQGDAVAIGSGTDTGVAILDSAGNNSASQQTSGTTWIAQRVRFSAVRRITHIAFRHAWSQNQTYVVRIRETLTGADLATGSVTPNASNGSIGYRTAALGGGGIDIDPNKDYYLIFSGNYFVYGQTTSFYADGEAYLSTNSGAAWSTHPTIADFGVYALGGVTIAGRAYKATSSLQAFFIGFAQAAATAGNPVFINPQKVIKLLTGLTIGSRYYLSTTAGILSTSGTFLVGIAVSTTVLIRDSFKEI